MTRERGFYWVKYWQTWYGPPEKNELVWEIALWEYGEWRMAGTLVKYSDTKFVEINENRIKNRRDKALKP